MSEAIFLFGNPRELKEELVLTTSFTWVPLRRGEALKDYVGIHVGSQRYVVHATLQDMESRVPAKQFMRVHRSFIVRLDKIHSVEEGEITLENNTRKVTIGGSFLGKVRERLDPL